MASRRYFTASADFASRSHEAEGGPLLSMAQAADRLMYRDHPRKAESALRFLKRWGATFERRGRIHFVREQQVVDAMRRSAGELSAKAEDVLNAIAARRQLRSVS